MSNLTFAIDNGGPTRVETDDHQHSWYVEYELHDPAGNLIGVVYTCSYCGAMRQVGE